MANIELSDSEVDVLWSMLIEESCSEFISMQKAKTATDLLQHKQRKDVCDDIIQRINQFKNVKGDLI